MPSDRHSVSHQESTQEIPHQPASASDPAQHGIFRHSHGLGLHHSPGVTRGGDSKVDGEGLVVRSAKIGAESALEKKGCLVLDLDFALGALDVLHGSIKDREKISVTLQGLPSGMFLQTELIIHVLGVGYIS
jgi:hypothetical protein